LGCFGDFNLLLFCGGLFFWLGVWSRGGLRVSHRLVGSGLYLRHREINTNSLDQNTDKANSDSDEASNRRVRLRAVMGGR